MTDRSVQAVVRRLRDVNRLDGPIGLSVSGLVPPPRRDLEVRERVLDVASGPFDGHGVHTVETQQVIDDFGCGWALPYRESPPRGLAASE